MVRGWIPAASATCWEVSERASISVFKRFNSGSAFACEAITEHVLHSPVVPVKGLNHFYFSDRYHIMNRMPRRHPIPQREAEICRRVKEMRVGLKLTRAEFGTFLGLDSSVVANIEHERTPVRAGVGITLCGEFSINYRWLATGKKPRNWFVPVYQDVLNSVDSTGLYSVAYDTFLGAEVEAHTDMVQKEIKGNVEELGDTIQYHGIDAPPGMTTDQAAQWYFNNSLKVQFQMLPEELKAAYLNVLARSGNSFMERNRRRIHLIKASTQPSSQKKDVDEHSELRNIRDMKSELPGLLKKVAVLAKPRGMKAKLAAELGVPAPRISEWLAGKHEPSGDIALKLRTWVSRLEAK
jgi:transcriptional regulator with XRE-family HTH domain